MSACVLVKIREQLKRLHATFLQPIQIELQEKGRLLGKRLAPLWAIVRRTPPRYIILYAATFVRHLYTLRPLLFARSGSQIATFVRVRPEIWKVLLKPYIAANWNLQTRITRIVDHCETVQEIGGISDSRHDLVVDAIRLNAIDPRYRITFDQPPWLLSEGQLNISLWDDIDRIFSLAFCLSSREGQRIAYIGGIQGRREPDVLDRYREFTKAAAGMRPRDFLVEVFKMFCRSIDVVEIRAVSDSNHSSMRSLRVANPQGVAKELSYDEIWRERGGLSNDEGFFVLSPNLMRRPADQIPVKRKSLYRRRYAMLDRIELDFNAVTRFSPGTQGVPKPRWIRAAIAATVRERGR
jgi:uncharacterized protein VirK/YbjX